MNKIKTLASCTVAAIILMVMVSSTSHAADAVINGLTVSQIGTIDYKKNAAFIKLKNNTAGTICTAWARGQERTFYASGNILDQAIAVGLTAVSLNKKVMAIFVSPTCNKNTLLKGIAINK